MFAITVLGWCNLKEPINQFVYRLCKSFKSDTFRTNLPDRILVHTHDQDQLLEYKQMPTQTIQSEQLSFSIEETTLHIEANNMEQLCKYLLEDIKKLSPSSKQGRYRSQQTEITILLYLPT